MTLTCAPNKVGLPGREERQAATEGYIASTVAAQPSRKKSPYLPCSRRSTSSGTLGPWPQASRGRGVSSIALSVSVRSAFSLSPSLSPSYAGKRERKSCQNERLLFYTIERVVHRSFTEFPGPLMKVSLQTRPDQSGGDSLEASSGGGGGGGRMELHSRVRTERLVLASERARLPPSISSFDSLSHHVHFPSPMPSPPRLQRWSPRPFWICDILAARSIRMGPLVHFTSLCLFPPAFSLLISSAACVGRAG
ncbi:hypothetical protein LZ30DRAFT_426281 [Colletotrichum cereale]|nr:hypothetical protein LZ30DRAFT_426281 [Colletotrichum cereale]